MEIVITKKSLKKSLAVLMAALMVFCSLPMTSLVFAAEEASSAVSDGNVTGGNATNGNATDGNVTGGNVTGGNVTSGNISADKLTWSFDEESGTLTIEGEGPMRDYKKYKNVNQSSVPWWSIREKVKKF